MGSMNPPYPSLCEDNEMLKRIMEELVGSGGAVTIGELSRRLGVEPGAVEGMLQTLVRLGKLKEEVMGSSCGRGACRSCAHCQLCVAPSGQELKVYAVKPA